jgi:hypothetical protein
MSLNLSRLERLVERADGSRQARCPACAEGGHDRKGEHLRLYPDGRFGCCVHPQDREHRKRIFALAGERGSRAIQVRVTAAKNGAAIQSGVLGRLGRQFASPAGMSAEDRFRDAWDGEDEVQSASRESGTFGTAETESAESQRSLFGTLGTPFSYLRADAEKTLIGDRKEQKGAHTHKGFSTGVPSVPRKERQPYLAADGTLVIPFDSPERFHWWKGGQTVAETRAEVERGFVPMKRKEHDERTL